MKVQARVVLAGSLPESLSQQLLAFRRRLRMLKVVEVCLGAVTGVLVAYMAVFAVERFIAIPSGARILILILSTAGFSIGLPYAASRWFWRTRRLEQVPALLRSAYPALSDEILSVIEMANHRSGQGASPALVAAATEQTRVRVANEDLGKAASAKKAKTHGIIAVTALALTIVLVLIVPSAAATTWLRFLNPWTSTERFTFTRLMTLPDEYVVPYGESFQFEIRLHQESQWSPEEATATIGNATVTASLDSSLYRLTLPAQTQARQLILSVGDLRRIVGVVPRTRPELTSITAKTTLPPYLQYPDAIEQTTSSRRFQLVAGSEMEFEFLATQDVAMATCNEEPLLTHGRQVLAGPFRIDEASTYEINWNDGDGLRPREPIRVHVETTEDRPPSIVLERLEKKVLLESKAIRFNFSARDDFGIKKIGLEWTGAEMQVGETTESLSSNRGEKLLLAGSPDRRTVNESGIFTPKLEGVSAQVLTLRVFVEDYLGERGRIYSRPQTLHVMTDDEHVAWINEKMQNWKSTADAIYERELGLVEENHQLRCLTPEQSRDPENLRRMEAQVANERDNAQRLDAAVDDGRALIEQAMMNENLRAEQVAQWAESLQRLQKIAREEMPSVAEQLDDIHQDLQDEVAHTESPGTDIPSEAPVESKEKPSRVGENRFDQPPKASEGAETQAPDDGASAPSLQDVEDSMLEAGSGGPPQSGGRLTLPSTDLVNPKMENEETDPEDSSDQGSPEPPSFDGVVEDHEKLLEEFQDAREAMDGIMAEFENSTFVKRFKAASRSQLDIATQLNRAMGGSFGRDQASDRSQTKINALAEAQRKLFHDVGSLKIDLEAYQSREPGDSREAILREMNGLQMKVKLEELPKRLLRNRLGDSLHRGEFWADTFDRWAEELVPPARSNQGGGNNNQEQPSLPPAIVLEVMRQIEDETNLRDETRGFDLSKAAMPDDEVQERQDGLTVYQMSIQERSLDTIDDIQELPQDFGEEVSKLKNAVTAMNEATGMLFDRTTGEPTLAAESAAIEALLASRRTNPPGGGNPEENNSGKDGSESLADGSSAMDMLRPSSGLAGRTETRDVGAGTSANLDGVPERFRDGIDRFTDKLGRLRRAKNQ